MERIIHTLIALAPHTRIAHHQPGRIRLKIFQSALNVLNTSDIGDFVESIPGILDYRVNLWAKSIVINYDGTRLPFDLWVLLAEMGRRPELKPLVTARLRTLWVERS
jgi:hypothetical protein